MTSISKGYYNKEVGVTYEVVFIIILSLFFLFQNVLELYIPAISYSEDIISLMFFLYFIFSTFKFREIKIEDAFSIIILSIIMLLGLYFNIRYKFQKYNIAIIIDIISTFKFCMIYIGFSCYLDKRPNFNFNQVSGVLSFIAKVYIMILFVCAILNIFIDIGMYQEYRYGLRTFSFIFGTPGQVINTSILILLILCMDRTLSENENKNTLFIFITWLVLLSTLKSRALILAVTFFFLYETLEIEKKSSMKIRIIMVAIIGCIVGYSQFEYYFLSGSTPRLRFLKAGVELFKTYFPFGSGFATFGSGAAAKYYSPLYYQFEFNNFYGMSPEEPLFLNDTFWPMIIGQLGFIGIILFVFLLGSFLITIYKKSKLQNNTIKLAVLFYIFNVLFSSIQSSYPGSNSMIFTTYFIVMILICRSREKEVK